MHYYFPISIDGRRLHYFKLENHGEQIPVPKCSFLIKVHDNVSLLSVDSDEPCLICSEKIGDNVGLVDSHFRIEKADKRLGELPTYIIHIEKGKRKRPNSVDDPCLLKGIGRTGTEERAVVKVDSTQAFDEEKRLLEPTIHVIVSYSDKDHTTYSDAVKFYFYTEDSQLASAALDFGSEASQIRFGGADSNLPIIDTLLDLNNDAGMEHFEDSKNYWQGKRYDPLYKSVFFIHTEPTRTEYAQKPLIGLSNRAFVQPLLSSTTPKSEYAPLELLPNLKLVEIGASEMHLPDRKIKFEGGTDIEVGTFPNLSSRPLRGSILRIILSNFLHCVLHVVNANKNGKFLRMVLMVPNVYYQSKINKLVRDLYEDYASIQENALYPNCKGFEVQVVSESDAAFLGVRNTTSNTRNGNGAYFLIIDAGKGTTDFSILQQHKDFSQYSSLYRDGIPASGNALTYAFHEALHAYLSKSDIQLNAMLKSAEKAELLQYMSCLEQFKQDYGTTSGECAKPDKNNINSMAALVSYLQHELHQRHAIPGSDQRVAIKVKDLCECLEHSMKQRLNKKGFKFLQVLLTGRGFLFNPFRKAVIDMLLRNGWLGHEDDVIQADGDKAKTICLAGALAIEKECSVNCNSGLIGSPIIKTTENYSNRFQRFVNGLSRSRKKAKEIDLDFFYKGSGHSSSQNITVIIGGRTYPPITSQRRENKVLFYTGDGFICLKESSCEKIDERNFEFTDTKIRDLVRESLFPFHPVSILDDHAMPLVSFASGRAPGGSVTTKSDSTQPRPDTPLVRNNDDMDK